MQQSDILVIGSGVAGMWFALEACKYGSVTMITKTRPLESNSAYAQGGIASVWHEDDDPAFHVRDTLVAGAGLCRRDAVEQTVRDGPARVHELIERGAQFTRRQTHPDEYDLHREGGHSHRRILHAADFTGREIVRALNQEVREHPQIAFLDHHMAVDVLTRRWLARRNGDIPPEDDEAIGAYVLDTRSGLVRAFSAPVTLLATGGAGKLYRYTSNPDVATGDGMAMAYRAGAVLSNMEFVQFHPTCLYDPQAKSFLVSEAVRGEGGVLKLPDGTEFMVPVHPMGSLAPRDIVARAIDDQIKRWGLEYVLLDISHKDAEFVRSRFPGIHDQLMEYGHDMTRGPIPVVPAAHYFCGGVQVDRCGRTLVAGLLAAGEVTCTGLHGANRLASNSLLEACVTARRCAGIAPEELAAGRAAGTVELPAWESGRARDSDELVVIKHTWDEIRRLMWDYVGIVRTDRRLQRALNRIDLIKEEIQTYYWDFTVTSDLVELRNLATVAEVVIRAALGRRESRGLHYNLDCPETDDANWRRPSLLRREW